MPWIREYAEDAKAWRLAGFHTRFVDLRINGKGLTAIGQAWAHTSLGLMILQEGAKNN